ncbi:MAG: hypothetical protein VX265_04680 [Myxococcota bacterium]|nr:hypothetical protein [Myxococcota bacterium]MEC8425421.1 hypothetical protein [Myxococcota bacterium]
MKNWRRLCGALLVGFLSYLGLARVSGGAYPTPGIPLGGDLGELRRTSMTFWEDIQFKDFDRAATYHSPEKQAAVDIPFLIQRLFAVKPEALDVMSYEVVLADIDSTGDRGRVKTRVKVKILVDKKIREKEVMLYFHRQDAASPWYMELEDSLRRLTADEDKVH